MSRSHYKNEHIGKAFEALDNLEQSMGWNLRCAFVASGYAPTDSVMALAQIVEAAAEVRRLVGLAEAEAIKLFRDEEVKSRRPLRDLSNEELAELHHDEYLAAAHCQAEPAEMQAQRDRCVQLIQAEAARRGINLKGLEKLAERANRYAGEMPF
jgi:hypothetical protein